MSAYPILLRRTLMYHILLYRKHLCCLVAPRHTGECHIMVMAKVRSTVTMSSSWPSTFQGAVGAEVYYVVRGLDHVEVVLDHDHGLDLGHQVGRIKAAPRIRPRSFQPAG